MSTWKTIKHTRSLFLNTCSRVKSSFSLVNPNVLGPSHNKSTLGLKTKFSVPICTLHNAIACEYKSQHFELSWFLMAFFPSMAMFLLDFWVMLFLLLLISLVECHPPWLIRKHFIAFCFLPVLCILFQLVSSDLLVLSIIFLLASKSCLSDFSNGS